MVLLKNEGDLLPLMPGAQRIALIGPLAGNRESLLGCWSGQGRPDDVESILDGLRAHVGEGGALSCVPGCALEGGDADFSAAVAAAEAADVVIAALGESAAMSGEAHSRADLGLPGRQQALLDALHATGKPINLVLLTGRPLVIPDAVAQVGALLLAWHGGIRAGQAVADILFGVATPPGS